MGQQRKYLPNALVSFAGSQMAQPERSAQDVFPDGSVPLSCDQRAAPDLARGPEIGNAGKSHHMLGTRQTLPYM
jgi:hypothetical protein